MLLIVCREQKGRLVFAEKNAFDFNKRTGCNKRTGWTNGAKSNKRTDSNKDVQACIFFKNKYAYTNAIRNVRVGNFI